MTLICGLKLTHDGAVALLEDTADEVRLIAATEVEKFGNRLRHAPLADSGLLQPILNQMGVSPQDIDRWVVDGWYSDDIATIGPGAVDPPLRVTTTDEPGLLVAPYCQNDDETQVLHKYASGRRLQLGGIEVEYESYRHAEGHLASAYMSGPGGIAVVLLWDGRLCLQAYLVEPDKGVEFLGVLLDMPGTFFEEFACNIGPFVPDPQKTPEQQFHGRVSAPGKAMAYAGLGHPDDSVVAALKAAFLAHEGDPDGYRRLYPAVQGMADDPCLMASLQQAVADLLVERVRAIANRADLLCFAGGSALNIKWNSSLRASGLFSRIWVPPFPNDSGSAIGAACASVMSRGRYVSADWSVFSGPALEASGRPPGWSKCPSGINDLVALLVMGEPVVVLQGRAELGPRALGHRSILGDPRSVKMKALLNDIKGREDYRPVAPICLEENAREIFDPGVPDPYMLFDHRVRPDWLTKIPAVIHVDGTARLQTVSDGFPEKVVRGFYQRTGIPVLCNTSANLNGSGFFPDAETAMSWGRTKYVWADGVLYTHDAS